MHRSTNRNRNGPPQRRSQSSHQPYHAISETYSKEVTTRPLGPVENFSPDIVSRLRDTDAPSPPLIRSRENTWTSENFPIVRVPSAQFTDILTELYDYHEIEKYTRRSITPDLEMLRRESEFKESPIEKKILERVPSPPTYQVIPPTPEKNNTPREAPEVVKKRLPMYEEYVMSKKFDENLNPPIPRPRSKSPKGSFDQQNLRHIDSSSSESTLVVVDELQKRRHVYTHDVYVDAATGRPYTPGREDLDEKNCGRLKINVYFKPPHPPVEPVYRLDEIQIEKHEEIPKMTSRPPGTPILDATDGPKATVDSNMSTRRIPTRVTLLRKENEMVTVPLNRSLSARHSRTSARSAATTERTIPIHVDEGFQRIPRHLPPHQEPRSIDKGEAPRQRYPSTSSTLKDRQSERTASFISDRPSKVVQSVSSSRAADVIDARRPPRQSPEELDYGKTPVVTHFTNQENGISHLPYTRGISKTPSIVDTKSERYSNTIYSNPSPIPVRVENSTPELPYTRGISKTPSIKDHVPERSYTKDARKRPEPVPKYSQTRSTQNPYEEVVHIKERYEKDETIRRFFPTTTTV